MLIVLWFSARDALECVRTLYKLWVKILVGKPTPDRFFKPVTRKIEGLEAAIGEPHRKRCKLGSTALPSFQVVDTILILCTRGSPAREVGPASNVTQDLASEAMIPETSNVCSIPCDSHPC